MDEPVFLSIVIPAYNEAARIGKTIDRILDYLGKQQYRYELILVNDGSSDNTQSVILSYQTAVDIDSIKIIHYTPNRGKGFAVKTGMFAAKGKYVLFSDADLSTPIEELDSFLPLAEQEGYQIIIGSRGLSNSMVLKHQPWFRETMGKIFNRFVQWLVFPGIKDTQCGFKLFRAEVVHPLFSQLSIDRFSFDVEILYLAQKSGFRIKEAPVHWLNSPATKVNPITDATRMLFDLIAIRWRHRGKSKS